MLRCGLQPGLSCASISLMWPFVKSVLLGAVAGAAPLLIFTCTLALMSLPEGLDDRGGLLSLLWLAILPLIISISLVLGASIVVGLPLTALLKRQGWESASAYMSVGAIAGFLLPIAILLLMAAPAGYWMALLGAVGGAVTGRTWWVSGRTPNIGDPD